MALDRQAHGIGVRDPMPGVTYPPADVLARYVQAGALTRETLAGALVAAFERHRDRPAIVGPQASLTHGQLDERSDRLAAALLALGIRPRERALFQLANSAELIVAVLACLKLGVIPVCTLASHRELEIGTLGRQSEASLWFVQGDDPRFDFTAFAERLRPAIDSVREVVVVGGEPRTGQHGMEALIAAQPHREAQRVARAAIAQLDPFQVAVFQLSGGTTGVSKLIPRFSNEYLFNMRAVLEAAARRAPEVCFCGGPFLHNAGFVLHWGPALLLGGAIAIGKDLGAEGLCTLFLRERPTWAYLPKPLAIRLADGLRARGAVLDSLATVMTTASAAYVRRELGARAINIYGMAEGIVMMPRADDPFELIDASVGAPLSPLDEVRIVRAGSAEALPAGETGELLVRGPTTLHGYYPADERGRNPFIDDGWLRTGDLMQRVRIGGRDCYAFKGRLKDVIKRAGESIDCDEVERALRDHPAVADVALVGVPDARYGERACACLVLKPGAAAPGVAQLGEHFARLGFAKFKWPEFIHVTTAFPLTPSGKLSKPLLREQAKAAIEGDHKEQQP
ncbi:AMP-binding protein [Variovorax sp. JS1663]|uniref:AMP-binding protein n=1 Tax=Variovorax sp. JS1663 TaxID=1851577 RepID=UPI000B348C29|nr:AMP-binding protein [Variovorax sp. JS1663]OUM02451.1 hypothetical protein A8M77_10785 [Variovorax sp. JS1663]OUM02464.1 hypothetical protein A8M77_10860 [Variovorax sp. JS1663]